MFAEFKTLWELQQEGAFEKTAYSVQEFINKAKLWEVSLSQINEQIIIAVLGILMVGIIFLPLGATESSIQKCQIDTNQKVVKIGGVLIVVMTSISAILFIEVLELSEMLGGI